MVKAELIMIKSYLEENPLALNAILDVLSKGKTSAGELSRELESSLTSTYRKLRELEEMGILKSKKEGRKRIFYIASDEIRKILIELTSSINQISSYAVEEKKPIYTLTIAKTLRRSFRLRFEETYIMRMFKSSLAEIICNILSAEADKNIVIKSPLIKRFKCDFALRLKDKTFAFVVKVVTRTKSVLELLGNITCICRGSWSGVLIPICLLWPQTGKLPISEFELSDMLRSLSQKNLKIIPIVKFVTEDDLLNPSFIVELAKDISKGIDEMIEMEDVIKNV